MEREPEVLRKLTDFLRDHGYPLESFALDWRVGDRHRADLAVVDPDTAEPIAIFELKANREPSSLRMAERQLRTYWDALGKPDVPLFAVTPDPERGFTLFRFDPEIREQPSSGLAPVPDFALLRTTQRSKATAEAVVARRRNVDRLAITSWIAAAVVGGLTALDLGGLVEITPERFGLIALAAGLVVLPFASKLKLLGLEFERYRGTGRKDGDAA